MTRQRSDGSLNARSVGPVRLTSWNAYGWLVWLRFRWWRSRTVTKRITSPMESSDTSCSHQSPSRDGRRRFPHWAWRRWRSYPSASGVGLGAR